MTEYYNWINKRLDDLIFETEFNYFFNTIDLEEIEDSYYLTNKSKGIELVFSRDKVATSIHLFSKIDGDYNCFNEALPNGLQFSDTRQIVHTKLGKPDIKGGGISDIYMSYIHEWDKYYFQEFSLHLEYNENNNGIRILTIGSLELEFYFINGNEEE